MHYKCLLPVWSFYSRSFSRALQSLLIKAAAAAVVLSSMAYTFVSCLRNLSLPWGLQDSLFYFFKAERFTVSLSVLGPPSLVFVHGMTGSNFIALPCGNYRARELSLTLLHRHLCHLTQFPKVLRAASGPFFSGGLSVYPCADTSPSSLVLLYNEAWELGGQMPPSALFSPRLSATPGLSPFRITVTLGSPASMKKPCWYFYWKCFQS